MDGLHSFSYFPVFQSLYQWFGDCTERTDYNCYYRQFLVPWFFRFPSKVQVLIFLFAFFQFYSLLSWDGKVYNSADSLFRLLSDWSIRLYHQITYIYYFVAFYLFLLRHNCPINVVLSRYQKRFSLIIIIIIIIIIVFLSSFSHRH